MIDKLILINQLLTQSCNINEGNTRVVLLFILYAEITVFD